MIILLTLITFLLVLAFLPAGHNEDPSEGLKTPGPKKKSSEKTPKNSKNKRKKKKKQAKEKKKDQKKAEKSKKTGEDKESKKQQDEKASESAEKKEESREIEGDNEANEQFRFLKQCWLLENVKDLVEFRAAKGNFINFSMITDPPAKITSKLLGNSRIQPLMCLTEAQKALLVPRIRLFKVDSVNDKSAVEFPFASNYSIKNRGDIFKSVKHSGQGSGIKSFTYDLSGVNPAEADRFITVNISLFFASISDLFADLDGSGLAFKDLISYRRAKASSQWNGEDFKIRAVVGWAEPSDPAGTIIDNATRAAIRQARVSLGLQLVQHSINLEMDGTISMDIEYIGAFEGTYNHKDLNVLWAPGDKAMSQLEARASGKEKTELLTREANFLNQIKSDLAALKGGNVKNKALVDKMKERFDQADLPADSFSELREIIHDNTRGGKKNAKKLVIENTIFQRGAGLGSFDLTEYAEEQNDGLNERREKLKEEIEEAGAELEKKRKQLRIMRYSRIVEQLHERGILYVVDVPSTEIGEYVSGGVFGDDQTISTSAAIKERASTKGVKAGKIKASNGTEASKELGTQLKDSSKTDSSDEFNSKEVKETNAYEEAANTEDMAQVHFFFLGDLYDIYIDILRKSIDHPDLGTISPPASAARLLDKIKFLMGPITLREEASDGKTTHYTVNIAEIPISLDLFSTWFAESIVDKERRNYLLKDIMLDSAVGLVSAGLEQGCFRGKKQKSQFAAFPLTTPSGENGQPRIPPHGARCRVSQISQAIKLAQESAAAATSLTNVDNYMFFYGKEDDPSYLGQNMDSDHAGGIYHIHVGKECGLLTGIKFKRADVKYLRESRLTADAQDDEWLREKYDADLTMIGNTLFFPGQYVYIDHLLPGVAPSDRSKVQLLGFGGYYLVISVEHTISDEEYVTVVNAIWQTFGSRTADGYPATGAPKIIPASANYNCVGGSLEAPSTDQTPGARKDQGQFVVDKSGNKRAAPRSHLIHPWDDPKHPNYRPRKWHKTSGKKPKP